MTDPPRSRPATPAPQGEVQMNPHQALQTAINQIAELRSELNEIRNLVQTNRHLGNETQISIEQKLSALLESLRVSADSTYANTTAVTRAVEKVTATFSRSDHSTCSNHPNHRQWPLRHFTSFRFDLQEIITFRYANYT